MHLSHEFLSAYADGELPPSKTVAAAAHLRVCAGCTETVRLFTGLDERLSSTPALGCSAALSLVSGQLDGELDRAESAIAQLHLATCADCRTAVLRWSVADQAIASLPPARPSARVDAAIAALGRKPAGLRLPRVAWPVPAFAVAIAVAILLVVNLSLVPAGAPAPALVAAAEQSVLNAATGTLYVLHPENGTVAALDARTLASRGVISVGGRPTALALNPTTNTLVVLDATAKTVTEIDCASNLVTSSTAVTVPGRPTSLQVDPTGKLVVTSVVAPATSIPAPVAAAPAGVVSVFDGGTKKLETVKSLDVAVASVVWQPNGGKRALLVAADSTTLVETATYQTIATYGGGLAAVFSANGADFAILSTSKDGAVVTRQNGSTIVGGTARAITALPDGGFAVLFDANAKGHISMIDASGTVTQTLDVVAGGRDLAYDAQTRQLTVVGTGIVSNVALPAPAPATAPAVTAVQAPSAPVTAPTVIAPTTDPTKPAAVAPAQPSAPAVEIVAPSQGGLVPSGAREVWPGTYLVQLAQRPRLAVSDEDRIWMLDAQNHLSALHPRSGELFQLAQLPASAQVAQMVVSPSHVFLTDPRAGLIYMFSIDTERLASIAAPFLPIATDLVASPDDRLWIGTTGLGLLSLDPQTQKLVTTDAEANVSAVGTDPLGRIWLGLGSRQVVGVYDPLTRTVTELNLAHDGSVSAIAIDGAGTVWVGTDSGQLFAIRNQQLQGAAALGRRIDDLVVDAKGQVWYLSRTNGELLYGLASGAGLTQHAARAASGPLFDRQGRSWLADGSSYGLFVTLNPAAQP